MGLLLTLLVACGGEEALETLPATEEQSTVDEETVVEVTRVVVEEGAGGDALTPGQATRTVPASDAAGTEPGPGDRPDDPAPGTGPKGEGAPVDPPPPAPADAPREEPAGLGDSAAVSGPPPAAGGVAAENVLTAGLVDDNADRGNYLTYLAAYAGPLALAIDVSEAVAILSWTKPTGRCLMPPSPSAAVARQLPCAPWPTGEHSFSPVPTIRARRPPTKWPSR